MAVRYTLSVRDDLTGEVREFREDHVMRYLFLEEIEHLARATGFRLKRSGKWMDDAALDAQAWLGWCMLVAA